MIPTVSPLRLKTMSDWGDKFVLLDVRSDEDYNRLPTPGSRHIPFEELASRLSELNPLRNQDMVVVCQQGMRALVACEYLERQGFTKLSNLFGGIDAYTRQCEPPLGQV